MNDDRYRIGVLERRVEILSRYLVSAISGDPIQARSLALQLAEADYEKIRWERHLQETQH